jgi:hypothetical protein
MGACGIRRATGRWTGTLSLLREGTGCQLKVAGVNCECDVHRVVAEQIPQRDKYTVACNIADLTMLSSEPCSAS